MLKSQTSTPMALSGWLTSGRRGQRDALRPSPSHAVVGSGRRGAIHTSAVIAVRAVLLGAHTTAGHTKTKVAGRGEAPSTTVESGVSGLSLTRSSAHRPLVPSGMPVAAACTESLLHRRNGCTSLIS